MTKFQALVLDEFNRRIISVVPLNMRKKDSDETTVFLCAVSGIGVVTPIVEWPRTPDAVDRNVASWVVVGCKPLVNQVDPWFVEKMCEEIKEPE